MKRRVSARIKYRIPLFKLVASGLSVAAAGNELGLPKPTADGIWLGARAEARLPAHATLAEVAKELLRYEGVAA